MAHCTVSKNFAKHLNALHSSRRAFIRAESSERVSLVANESNSESGYETEKVHEPLNLEEEPEIAPVPILPEVQIQQNAEIVRPKEKQKIPSIGENIKYRAKDNTHGLRQKLLEKVVKLQGRTWHI